MSEPISFLNFRPFHAFVLWCGTHHHKKTVAVLENESDEKSSSWQETHAHTHTQTASLFFCVRVWVGTTFLCVVWQGDGMHDEENKTKELLVECPIFVGGFICFFLFFLSPFSCLSLLLSWCQHQGICLFYSLLQRDTLLFILFQIHFPSDCLILRLRYQDELPHIHH